MNKLNPFLFFLLVPGQIRPEYLQPPVLVQAVPEVVVEQSEEVSRHLPAAQEARDVRLAEQSWRPRRRLASSSAFLFVAFAFASAPSDGRPRQQLPQAGQAVAALLVAEGAEGLPGAGK